MPIGLKHKWRGVDIFGKEVECIICGIRDSRSMARRGIGCCKGEKLNAE